MKYTEKIKEYASQFPRELEKECQIQVKKLRNQGFTFEWIYRAISHKPQQDWIKHNFGLLHTESYQNQITNLLEAERNQLKDVDIESLSWDSLLDEETALSDEVVTQNENEENELETMLKAYEVI